MIADPSITIDRISVATPESPVAVFSRIGQQKPSAGNLYSYFSNTIQTQELINSSENDCLGVFHNEMDMKKIFKKLSSAVNDVTEAQTAA